MNQEPNLGLSTPMEQAQLLQQVLQASDKDLEEEETKDEDGKPRDTKVNRKEASISAFSGGSTMTYTQKPKKPGDSEKHPLFKLRR